MKTPFSRTLNHWLRSFGFLAALFCFAPGLYAGPVIFPGRSQNSVLAVYVAVAIFLEAVCVAWLLRKFHRPRFFILWVLGTHLLTFPAFLGFVWLLQPLFQDFTITLAEGLVVWPKAGCSIRFAGAQLPPSIRRCPRRGNACLWP